MKLNKDALKLYAVTDRHWTKDKTLYEQIKECLTGGVTMIQLREKNLSYSDFKSEGINIKKLCNSFNVPFLINDNVSLAKEIDADGVHIGQNDMELVEARKILGNDKIIGVSARTIEQAICAEKNGANYLGVGAVFQTSSKDNAVQIDIQTLKDICSAVQIPVVAIGGISNQNIKLLKNSGIAGVAVISAIFSQKDIKLASKQLLSTVEEILHA